jgi:hypothetical protein
MKEATYMKLLPHAGEYAYGEFGEYRLHDVLAFVLVMMVRRVEWAE